MILLYETADAKRNEAFILELQRFADFELVCWDDWSEAGLDGLLEKLKSQTVLFRCRRPDAARYLEDRGVRLVNRAEVNRIANNKWLSYQLFQVLGIPAITTYREPQEFPCVIKSVDGHGGQEVEMVEWADSLPAFSSDVIYQPVVPHTADIRAYVIGDEVVGAVKRSSDFSFKKNFSLGAEVERYELDSIQELHVLKIARAVKADYIGIDFLLLEDGRHLFNEVEDPVGARSFYQTHEDNIAELLVRHLEKKYD
ncbi:RimK family alpha-L-glutamate ligase [Planomicrobium sp. MB-3u-38]|uniref:ATP-grasp domain-containing protein n=1 Tax=Planomicrobium sp. MB-3u-38 TaxID=2058318 RepID=UPI000C79C596|nr:alpha-L-glutamate ligase [Planomicrobium sp. MB-3u-38]PKH09251.1 alpha-L-glutamate ligase [Planomicrobium sp. MB-3u-38]